MFSQVYVRDFSIIVFRISLVCYFPRAPITKYQKLDGLKQLKFVSYFWRLEV